MDCALKNRHLRGLTILIKSLVLFPFFFPLFQVESILGKKKYGTKHLYLVHWQGFSSDHDSWEPRANLEACKSLIKLFNDNQATSVRKSQQSPLRKQKPLFKPKDKRYIEGKTMRATADQLLLAAKKKPGGIIKPGSKFSTLNDRKRLRHSAEGLINRSINLKNREKRKRNTLGSSEIWTAKQFGDKMPEEVLTERKGLPESDQTKSIAPFKAQSKNKSKLQADQAKTKERGKSGKRGRPAGGAKKTKVSSPKPAETAENVDVHVISDEETNDEDDDVLYSLNSECDIINLEGEEAPEKLSEKGDSKPLKPKKIGKLPKSSQERKSLVPKEKAKKTGGKKKRISLMESKKNSKDWISKSGTIHH